MGATDTSGATFGKLKVNVKDGVVKFDVKVEGGTAGSEWVVELHQDKYSSGCHFRDEDDVGLLMTDASGKGSLKGTWPLACDANRIWVYVGDGMILNSTAVSLPASVDGCP